MKANPYKHHEYAIKLHVPTGHFLVQVCRQGEKYNKTFHRIEDARVWRDATAREIPKGKVGRPKKDWTTPRNEITANTIRIAREMRERDELLSRRSLTS